MSENVVVEDDDEEEEGLELEMAFDDSVQRNRFSKLTMVQMNELLVDQESLNRKENYFNSKF